MKHSIKHIRRTEKQIRALLILQQKENLKVIEFCKIHKIHKATFYNWRNKYSWNNEEQQGFVPVHFSEHVTEAILFAQIELASNVSVKLFQKVDASYFKALM